MRSPLINIVIFYLTCVRPSTARETQTEGMTDELSLLIRRVNNLEEEKDNEIIELREKIEDVREENKELRTQNKELQEKIEDIQNPPFGYFCSYQDEFYASNSVITYDKLLYSSHFGLQGDSPGIDINTGKFVAGFSGTWRVDFSLYTANNPGDHVYIYLYKNEEVIGETLFHSFKSFSGSGYDKNTGGRSVLLHLDLGDELYLGTTDMEDTAEYLIFCVSLEQFDV